MVLPILTQLAHFLWNLAQSATGSDNKGELLKKKAEAPGLCLFEP